MENQKGGNTMPKKIEVDLDELRRLHATGMHDGPIGKQLGCSGVTICSLRKKLGLAAHHAGGRKASGNGKALVGPNSVRPGPAPLAAAVTVPAVVAPNGHGHGSLRVVMFEVSGGSETTMAALDAVKAALSRS